MEYHVTKIAVHEQNDVNGYELHLAKRDFTSEPLSCERCNCEVKVDSRYFYTQNIGGGTPAGGSQVYCLTCAAKTLANELSRME